MRSAFEAEKKVIETDLSVRCEAIAHGGEVDGAVMLVNLDGVPPAERDVGAAFAGEMAEDSLTADGAAWTRLAGGDFGAFARP
jgi:hypothetical protein